MLVVVFHATAMTAESFGVGTVWLFGASGVDIFFSISGFVMVLATRHYWGRAGVWQDFLLGRLIRIAPLYWGATAMKLVLVLMLPALALHNGLNVWHITASFLFIPAWNIDNLAFPLLPVGWTLNFEMFFYCLFAVTLACRVSPVKWLPIILVALSSLSLFEFTNTWAIGSLTSPILLEFVFGMLVGWATLHGHRLPVWLASICAPFSLVLLVCTQLFEPTMVDAYKVLFYGLPSVVLLLCAIGLEDHCKTWVSGFPTLLGDASYSIYLAHGFVLPVVGVLLHKFHLTDGDWSLFAVVVGCASSGLIGIIVHHMIEKPLTVFLNTHIRRRPDLKTINITEPGSDTIGNKDSVRQTEIVAQVPPSSTVTHAST